MSVSPDDVFLEPSDESARRLFERAIEGPVTMLNLLRFREVAGYSGCPELAPAEPISGRRAYEAYIRHTLPFLEASGGSLTFYGVGGHNLIGPPEERWDLVALVKQAGLDAFFAFASKR